MKAGLLRGSHGQKCCKCGSQYFIWEPEDDVVCFTCNYPLGNDKPIVAQELAQRMGGQAYGGAPQESVLAELDSV